MPYNSNQPDVASICALSSVDSNSDIVTKYGKVSIDFGEWDKEEINWDLLFKEYYRIFLGGIVSASEYCKGKIIDDVREFIKNPGISI